MRRNRSVALIAAGSTCVVVSLGSMAMGVVNAHAEGEPGSGFGVLSLIATSGGQRFITTGTEGEAAGNSSIPYAEALIGGPRSAALASAAWPGAIAGNAGSLLAVLAGPGSQLCAPNDIPIPEQLRCTAPLPIPQEVADNYSVLNNPLRAEADNSKERAQTTGPGYSMVATADDLHASAESYIGSAAKSGAGSLGTSRAFSRVKKTGEQEAIADAESSAEDIALLPGLSNLITIESVTSEAHAVTDGLTSKASGRTVVNGMKINDVPVTVDGEGVHAGGQTAPLGPATDAVNTVLNNFQITIELTKPTQKYDKQRNSVTYDAGSLIITMPGGFQFVFGGAQVVAASSEGFDLGDFDFPIDNGGGFSPGNDPGGGFVSPVDPGGVVLPPAPDSGNGTGLPGNPQPEVAVDSAPRGFALPDGVQPVWPIAALLGGVLLAGGFRRLPDRILDAPPTACPNGED